MDERAKSSIVRVYKKQDSKTWPIGCGFLAGVRSILTCWHVVRDALSPETDLLDKEIMLDFPFPHPCSGLLKAKVSLVVEKPDVARLELLSDPPKTAISMPLSMNMDLWGHPYNAFGVTGVRPEGFWNDGVLKSSIGDGTIQMDSPNSVFKIERGFSGTAIWDDHDQVKGAVGMVVMTELDPVTKAAYGIPMAEILEIFPDLKAIDTSQSSKVPLPTVWNVPIQRNPNFFGRKDILADLAIALNSGELGAWKQALWGMGGVGKTQIAVEYAYLHRSEYRVIWWLRSEEPSTLLSDYSQLAQKLGIGGELKDLNAVAGVVKGWLQQNPGWLLIFDNAQNPEQIKGFLPGDGPGHVIITSRNQEWVRVARKFPIKIFKRDESVQFILKRTGQLDEKTAWMLAEELGDLPLALEQAASYIETTSTPLAVYLDMFRKRRAALWAEEEKPIDYPDTVGTTWSLAMDNVRQEAGATDLLNLCAFLAPDKIPFDLLIKSENTLPQALSALANDRLAFNRAVKALRRYSLVESDDKALSIHRLVQAVTRDRMGEEEQKKCVEIAVMLIDDAYPNGHLDNLKFWPSCSFLLSHALVATGYAERFGITLSSTGRLLNDVGLCLKKRGEFVEAKAVMQRVLKISEQIYGPDHPDVAKIVNNLGLVLRDLGKFPKAKTCFERALKIDGLANDPNHPSLATDLNNLGLVLRDLGKFQEAKTCFERALIIDRHAYGPDHLNVARDVNSLGMVLRDLGKFQEAEKCFRKILKIYRRVYGPDHTEVATVINNLAAILKDLHKFQKSRELFELALKIDENVYGSDHPSVARDVNNLGSLLRELGKFNEAKQCFERALKIDEYVYGPDHPSVAKDLNNFGLLLREQGESKEAKRCFERALKIDEIAYSPDHPNVAIDVNNLGLILMDLGVFKKAKQCFERALKIDEIAYGPDHPNVANRANNLGSLLVEQGEFEGARRYFERALKIDENVYGQGHPNVAFCLNNLGLVLKELGDLQKSRKCFERALMIDEKIYGPNHPNVARDVNNLGSVLQAMGDLPSAKSHYERALKICRTKLGEDHPNTKTVLNNLNSLTSPADQK